MKADFGFRERPHTADWELEVWAPDLPSLLEQAARGMYALSGARMQVSVQQRRVLALQAADAEGLLVRFLTELLWLEQQDGLVFDQFDMQVGEDISLRAELRGAPLLSLDKEIKAVTYHNLEVRNTPRGLQVSIVFDV